MARIYSFDLLKAISIFLVIVGHVFLFTFHSTDNLIWSFINTVNMCMFMFISGFFIGTPSLSNTVKRFRSLILPTVTMGVIYTYVKGLEIEPFFLNSMHYGYWFCFTLFCFYLYYWLFSALEKALSAFKICNIYIYIYIGTSCLIEVLSKLFLEENVITDALSIPQFVLYLPYFVYGTLVRRYDRMRELLEHNNWLFTISLIGIFCGMYIGCYNTICRLVISFSYIHVMMYVSTNWFGSKANRWVDYLANRTIDVYLFHYFLLPGFYVALPAYFNCNTSIIFSSIIVGVTSILVLAGTLLLTKFIETSKMLKLIMLGKL